MVDMRMLAHRPVLLTNLIALVSGFAMLGSFVLIPNFVQAPGDLPDVRRPPRRLRLRRQRDARPGCTCCRAR